ncbi:MAG: WYL domain-containing protein [Candidatus Sumerlaeaceae bacterium]|nr:WYL domain-containing protein [Candidatus Sumerlaeaceae bacterium]
MRGAKYGRHWRIMQFILASVGGKRVDEIAAELECSTRTVRRDLVMLQHAGFPVTSEVLPRGRVWRLSKSFQNLPPIPFSAMEALTLMAAQGNLRAAGEDFLADQLDFLLAKLSEGRSSEFLNSIKRIEESLFLQNRAFPNSTSPPGHYDCVMLGIDRQLKLRGDYRNNSGKVTRGRVIAPLRLWIANRQTYLVAYCYRKKAVRTFSLRRFGQLALTSEKFKEQWEVDMSAIVNAAVEAFSSEPEDIELLFDRTLAQYLCDNPIHPNQSLTRTRNGIVIRAHIGISESLLHRLTGFGPLVMVRAPKALAELIAERHSLALEQYAFNNKTQVPCE